MLWNCPDNGRVCPIGRSVADLGQCSPIAVGTGTAAASPDEAAEATLFLYSKCSGLRW